MYNLVLRTLASKSIALYDHLLKGIQGLEPPMYLGSLFTSLFTGQLAIDDASRLLDVYVFEGDAILIRAAVAFLLRNEMTLLGCKTVNEALAVLSGATAEVDSAPKTTESGADEKFIKTIREVKMA